MALFRKRQSAGPERQELHCHACDRYVQFTMDMSLNGNHVLECPNCGHEHCRVVKDGVITEDRWASRNGPAMYVTAVTSSATSTFVTYSATNQAANHFLYQSWMNTGTST